MENFIFCAVTEIERAPGTPLKTFQQEYLEKGAFENCMNQGEYVSNFHEL